MTIAGLSPEYLLWLAGFVVVSWVGARSWQRMTMPLFGAIWLALAQPLAFAAIATVTLLAYAGKRLPAMRAATACAVAVLALIGLAYRAIQLHPELIDFSDLRVIGLAFAILKAIHYVLDGRNHRLPAHGFLDTLGYMFFFPTLMVGPILRFGDYHRETKLRRRDWANLSLGMERILIGCFKVYVLAGYLIATRLTDLTAATVPAGTSLAVYLGCLKYGLHLYFSFAGYCDVAIGAGLMVGMRVAENFRHPFLAASIIEFWNRWHITLSRWCRDYIFLPVAARFRRPAFAVICAMLILGIWHELSARYALWGLYHAFGIVTAQAWRRWRAPFASVLQVIPRRLRRLAGWAVTFNFVIVGFLITSTSTPADAWHALLVLVGIR